MVSLRGKSSSAVLGKMGYQPTSIDNSSQDRFVDYHLAILVSLGGLFRGLPAMSQDEDIVVEVVFQEADNRQVTGCGINKQPKQEMSR